ncbi:MAG: histidine ammonia-lyase [Pseudoruegeria sp.]
MTYCDPGATSLEQLDTIWRTGVAVRLDERCYEEINMSAARVSKAVETGAPVYGVNTGFGKLAHLSIDAADTSTLQRNLILSHCCGVGDPLATSTVRLMMTLKLLSLGRGASGVRAKTVALIEEMLARNVTPVIPQQGSVGASGDLAPLAHMAAVMIGEGFASFDGSAILPGGQAMTQAGLTPLKLGPKEGLALINGTQFSTACALVGLFCAWNAARANVVIAALSTDAIMGSDAPLHPEIHRLRGQPGQVAVAQLMSELMSGSEIRESHRKGDTRVQDPYCIRCQPQVAGAAVDLIRFAARTLEIEANAVTDNPLVLADGQILSGGNFHAEPVAFAADQIALAIAELGAISQRRIALMVDPTLSHDLPPFLTHDPGLNSGLMIAEVTSAALMSENKHLANPCSTDSTPTSANQEDHVSMAAHAALRLHRMTDNLSQIIGIEAICAAQGIETRAPLLTSVALQDVLQAIRSKVPALGSDRYMAGDLLAAVDLVRSGTLGQFADMQLGGAA